MIKYCLLALLCFIFKTISSDMITYNMGDMCGGKRHMSDSRSSIVMIKFHHTPSLLGILGKSCIMALDSGYWSDDVSWNRINIEILDFQNRGNSCVSFTQVNHDADWVKASSKALIGLSNAYCGSNIPPINTSFITEKYSTLVIRFDSAKYTSDGEISFQLVANIFHHDGTCSKYKCENGRCIPLDLKCSQFNPCGDHSHCQTDKMSIITIICIAVGITAGIIIMVFVIKCWISRRRRKSDDIIDDMVDTRMSPESAQPTPRRTTEGQQALPLLRTDVAFSRIEENDGEKSPDPGDSMPPPSYEEVMLK